MAAGVAVVAAVLHTEWAFSKSRQLMSPSHVHKSVVNYILQDFPVVNWLFRYARRLKGHEKVLKLLRRRSEEIYLDDTLLFNIHASPFTESLKLQFEESLKLQFEVIWVQASRLWWASVIEISNF